MIIQLEKLIDHYKELSTHMNGGYSSLAAEVVTDLEDLLYTAKKQFLIRIIGDVSHEQLEEIAGMDLEQLDFEINRYNS